MGKEISGRVPTAPSFRPSDRAAERPAGSAASISRAVPTEAEHMQAAFDRITHRQIMANARRVSAAKHRRAPNWVFAMDLFGLGSTYAWALCEHMGIDPDAKTLTPWPEREGSR